MHVFFWFDGEKTNLSVANDLRRDLKLTLEYGQSSLRGETRRKNKSNIFVKANSVYTEFGVNIDKDVKNGYLSAQISGDVSDKSVYFYNLWKDLPFETNLTVKVERKSENELTVFIKANEFARTVFIDVPYGVKVVLDDNYFDMEKGDERAITVSADFPLAEKDITVKTFADEWNE